MVLGAAGLVGSHVRRAFPGRRVVATFRRTPAPDAIPLDITDVAGVRRLIADLRPGVVVLAAAEAHVERCEREPEATRLANVLAAQAVVEAAREVDAWVVLFSSEYVFDGRAGPYGEDDAVAPINEYGRQKVELERLGRATARQLICRTSAVFGWEAAGKNFVSQLLVGLRAGEPFEVPSDQVVTPTYAPDLARAVADLLALERAGTFNVVGPQVLPRLEFARLAARAFSLPEHLLRGRPTAALGQLATRPRSAGLRDDKLRETLGHGLSDPAVALAAMAASERAV